VVVHSATVLKAVTTVTRLDTVSDLIVAASINEHSAHSAAPQRSTSMLILDTQEAV
jgi:hypothetical protein